ncbi:hypothetical protein BR93DRAFT_181286 [Coniochaeta sp. PMI_546]|nr:hypothetical protein BR93DRAFT_181286 [Coniochaeta sp. PMI_546]
MPVLSDKYALDPPPKYGSVVKWLRLIIVVPFYSLIQPVFDSRRSQHFVSRMK